MCCVNGAPGTAIDWDSEVGKVIQDALVPSGKHINFVIGEQWSTRVLLTSLSTYKVSLFVIILVNNHTFSCGKPMYCLALQLMS